MLRGVIDCAVSLRTLAVLGAISGVALIAPAIASASSATIVTPAEESSHLLGYAGPVVIDFGSDLTPGMFTISVTGETYSWTDDPEIDVPGLYSHSLEPIEQPGVYTVAVDEGGSTIATSTFTVQPR